MKRTKLLIAVLLILAASLILTGCPREPEEEIDPAADAGTWNTINFSREKNKESNYVWSATENQIKYPNYFSTNPSTQTIQYDFTSSDRQAAISNGHDLYEEVISDTNGWTTGWYKAPNYTPYSHTCMGFEATFQKASGNRFTPFGVIFNATSNGHFELLFERYDDDDTNQEYWIWIVTYNGNTYKWGYADAMKPVGQANTIKIRTRMDGKMELLINGTSSGLFDLPDGAPKSGNIYVEAGLSYEDTVIANNPDPVKITWKFNKFQQQQ